MAMIISADMRCRCVALFVVALGIAMAGSNHIQTVNSWADYRAMLKSMGRSDAEIDAQMARMLGALKTMDRTAGSDRIGVAAPTHGGVLCDLADAAMGMAFASTLAQSESFTTMSLSINCFRPVWQARLRAEAHVVSRGKDVGYVECEVTDQDGKQVPKANSTCFVLRGEQAKQR